ncbi:SMI1/KNR4 family protein [Actinomadura fulvescens]|uniref:SMI1/KNR4 family protein n=1 Tax=Actinomadura fulvescens TaxID=46160 RepID=A0ABN3PT01_9ACTN
MTDPDSLIRRVVAKAHEITPRLPPALSPAQIAVAEETLGFWLPPLLARLYQEIADGGFGPDYQLYPLNAGETTAVNVYQAERAESARSEDPHWPAGVLPILTWGCGMYAAVDCVDAQTPVLLFEPNAFDGDWAETWFVDAPTLEDWLESWLSDTGWFSVDGHEAVEDLPEPTPWTQATERLSISRSYPRTT